MLYEPRGYECVTMCDPDEILDNWKVSLSRYKNEEKIIGSWKKEGYTHLFVYKKGMEFLREDNDPHHPVEELNALDKFLDKFSDPTEFGGWYSLYELPNNSS